MSSSIFCKIVKSDKDEEVHFQLGYWPETCVCNCAKMNSFIYCKFVKPIKNTCEEAKILVKLLAYKYTTNQWTPAVLKNCQMLWEYLRILTNRLLHILHIILYSHCHYNIRNMIKNILTQGISIFQVRFVEESILNLPFSLSSLRNGSSKFYQCIQTTTIAFKSSVRKHCFQHFWPRKIEIIYLLTSWF